ncbi:N-acetylglucosamine kinase [Cohnella terricola]|uniref:ATPase n=1 Tax=Cohnella terricola TaxID=1289167 RepID=A0A559JBY8_9BACL|nr:BadF/BadG/BcrA/BcrD ATPase family protein [Cohnella terricola]TVX97392.1 ATPase [Cohnella terricola]
MGYVAGMDGGGTKTALTIANERGEEVYRFVSGPINFNGQDEESIRLSFEEMFAEIARVCGGLANCSSICIGAAGVSNPAVASRITELVRSFDYEGRLIIAGDHETALRGAHESSNGIILIAGTGSICYGRNEAGAEHRAGGCGHLIDDEGSGYSIGRELLSAVVRANDGRLPPTAITSLVYERLGVNTVRQVIGFAHDKKTNKKDIAALAPLLSDACELGDAAALAIVRKSAEALREVVSPVVERLSLQSGHLALAGSVLLRNEEVRAELLSLLSRDYPELSVYFAKREAAWGAVLMALE